MMAFYRFSLEVEGGAEPSSSSQVHDQISQSLLHLRQFDYTWLVVVVDNFFCTYLVLDIFWLSFFNFGGISTFSLS